MPSGDFNGKFVRGQQGLPIGLTATQGVDFEFVRPHVEFTADQAMRPVWVHRHQFIQHRYGSAIIGAADEHDLPLVDLLGQRPSQTSAKQC